MLCGTSFPLQCGRSERGRLTSDDVPHELTKVNNQFNSARSEVRACDNRKYELCVSKCFLEMASNVYKKSMMKRLMLKEKNIMRINQLACTFTICTVNIFN